MGVGQIVQGNCKAGEGRFSTQEAAEEPCLSQGELEMEQTDL